MHLLTILASGGGGAAVAQLGILLLIPLAMYFLMIRPQRRRMRDQAAMQSALEVGDEILTTSGVYGFITGFDEDRVWVEIDDDVQVRMSRAAIQGKVDTRGMGSEPKPELSKSSDAKSDVKRSPADDAAVDAPTRDSAG